MANSLNKVTTKSILDATIATADIADDAVTLAKMAGGTDGQIITYDASGNPVAVGPGTDGQVLTSTGAGSPPAFEAIPAAAVTAINNATQNELVTVGSTTTELDAEANLQFDGTAFRIGPSTKSSHTTVNDIFLGGAAHMYAETTAGAGNSFSVSQNAHVASDGGWKYVVTDEASNIYQYAGRIGFRTAVSGSADSAISWTEPATVWPHGITFNGDSAAANALDDYEEGTWTPTVNFGGGTTGITYDGNTGGAYTKIGRMVHIHGRIELTSKGSSSGNARIAGLPFSASNVTGGNSGIEGGIWCTYESNFMSGEDRASVLGYILVNEGTIYLYFRNNNGDIEAITEGDFENGTNLAFEGIYPAY